MSKKEFETSTSSKNFDKFTPALRNVYLKNFLYSGEKVLYT